MLELGLKVLLSFLLGSLNGSLILGRLKGVDIRESGSGNPGGTNALRTQGALFALGVMIIDVGKGFLPAWWLPFNALPGVPLDPAVSRTWLQLACAGAAIVGHCYPVWFQFAGGKGFATTIGAMLAVSPGLLPIVGVVWFLVMIASGMVGLATMIAAVSMPVYGAIIGVSRELLVFLALVAGFIVYTHRSNIGRILRGEEHRMAKAMFWRRQR
ncbi:MAG: glycerol-3-phosphate 1-O-acyltransferase PlsY [Gammaproteobacteria bacterium]|nr:glycerol-3-phosphate 1-O-acyltransferase PlsY [Gammaproteobacteria bacterium]